jgi:hypothetical protein
MTQASVSVPPLSMLISSPMSSPVELSSGAFAAHCASIDVQTIDGSSGRLN